MVDWDLKYYRGRKIEKKEDIMWVCDQIVKKNGELSLEDMAALSYLKELHKEHIIQGCFGVIESRFDILDL